MYMRLWTYDWRDASIPAHWEHGPLVKCVMIPLGLQDVKDLHVQDWDACIWSSNMLNSRKKTMTSKRPRHVHWNDAYMVEDACNQLRARLLHRRVLTHHDIHNLKSEAVHHSNHTLMLRGTIKLSIIVCRHNFDSMHLTRRKEVVEDKGKNTLNNRSLSSSICLDACKNIRHLSAV